MENMINFVNEAWRLLCLVHTNLNQIPDIMKNRWISALCAVAFIAAGCSESLHVDSPDGKIEVDVDGNGHGFSVLYDGAEVLTVPMIGLKTNARVFADSLKLQSVSGPESIQEDYMMKTGKRSHCVNEANERVFTFVNPRNETLKLVLRAYDDGIAFRYCLDSISDGEFLTDEFTSYCIAEGKKRWMQAYDPAYEGYFPLTDSGKSDRADASHIWAYPSLVELGDSLFSLITEADLHRGNCGSMLYNGNDPTLYKVRLADGKGTVGNEWTSPWRVVILGRLADIVESTLVTDVSSPSRIENTDWIEPGASAWVYWAHNHGSKDYSLLTEYVDLAADMQWPYNLIDWEWNEMSNGGKIDDIVRYAREKGIKTFMWYNSSTAWLGPGPLYRLNTKEAREKEFAWLKEIGVSGIKVDFFSGDSTATMNYFMDILESAADDKLMVNFHGATIPRGWQRTYPNLMSVEGVRGAEWYNNNNDLTAKAATHNATIPFTRNVVGPMDYTPGTFSDSQHPHITTYAHELALPILFESGVQHMPDRPESYRALPQSVKDLLTALPTAWDETRFVTGYPGECAVIARRKNDVWYIAGINGTDSQMDFTLDIAQYEGQKGSVTLFADGDTPEEFDIREIDMKQENNALSVGCLPRGGFVIKVL